MNNSKPFSLNIKDWGKGLFVAVAVAVLGGLQQLFLAHGLELASWDWGFLLNLTMTAFIAYMTKQYVSDSQGTPFGKSK